MKSIFYPLTLSLSLQGRGDRRPSLMSRSRFPLPALMG
jgi:hypothetical protein